MSTGVDIETRVSLKSCPDYLPRVRRIVACLAGSVRMDQQEIEDAALALSEACANAIRHGSPRGSEDTVDVVLRARGSTITAEVSDSGSGSTACVSGGAVAGFGMKLMRTLSDGVRFVNGPAGLTVCLTKHAKHGRDLSFPHRN